ncbi:MAG: hypothetical protein KGI97_00905 [Alphaproteobacteria bacterium]|nr:hypothetical protein [Alphaproteobacteria bacterium]
MSEVQMMVRVVNGVGAKQVVAADQMGAVKVLGSGFMRSLGNLNAAMQGSAQSHRLGLITRDTGDIFDAALTEPAKPGLTTTNEHSGPARNNNVTTLKFNPQKTNG